MILSDTDIKAALGAGHLKVDPLPNPSDIQPASLDVHLGKDFKILREYRGYDYEYLDTHKNNSWYFNDHPIRPADNGVWIPPHALVLASLAESITLPNDLACQIGGKSSLGRLGLSVHVTAGWVDPGWSGILTLELLNGVDWPIRVYPGDKIAQVVFYRLESPARETYNGKYQNATEAQVSRTQFDYPGATR